MQALSKVSWSLFRVAFVFLLQYCVPFHVCTKDSRIYAQTTNRDIPPTIAEASNFRNVANRVQVGQYLTLLDSAWDTASVQFLGKSLDGHPIEALVVSDESVTVSSEHERPLNVLVVGGMHPTEAIASQAALAVARDLLKDESQGWLKSLCLVVLPGLNPDNQIVSNQEGDAQVGVRAEAEIPVDGFRHSPMGLDLNRDYLALESPEIRCLVAAIERFQADVVIDLQAGTSVQHGYSLTYDISHHPATDAQLDLYLRGQILPEVTGRLARLNLTIFYSGQLDASRARWQSLDQSSGSISQYLALRGKIGLVCQANPRASPDACFRTTTAFLRETLRRLALDKNYLQKLLVTAQQGTLAGQIIPLTGLRQQASDSVRVLAELDSGDAVDGDEPKSDRVSRGDSGEGKLQELSVELWNQTKVETSIALPTAYAVPLRHSWLVSRLASHGVPIAQLGMSMEVQAEVAVVQELNAKTLESRRSDGRPKVQWQKSKEKLTAGTLVIQTSGHWGRLIAQMLEPESDENLATGGYLDPYLKVGETFPVLRLLQVPDHLRLIGRIPAGEDLSFQAAFEPDLGIKIAGQHSLSSIGWIESESEEEYVIEREKRWLAVSAISGQVRELVEVNQLVDTLQQIDSLTQEQAWDAVRRSQFWLKSHRYVPLLLQDRLYVFDRSSKRLHDHGPWKSGQAESMLLVSPNSAGDQVALVRDNDLWLLDCRSNQIKRLTNDGSHVRLNGILDWVYQEELYGRGNFIAHWWSPNSRFLAYLQLDQTHVPEYLIPDSVSIAQSIERTRYPKAGQPIASVVVRVIDIATGEERQIDLDGWPVEDRMIGRVSWSPKNQLVLQVLNRVQNQQELLSIDPESGLKQSLLREKTEGFLEIRGIPEFLSNGDFLWLSDLPEGRTHLYRLRPGTDQRHALTSGQWDVGRILSLSSDDSRVYLEVRPGNSIETHVLRVDLSSGELQRLTKGGGTHNVQFSPSGAHYIDITSDLGNPPRSMLYRSDSNFVRTVSASSSDRHNYLKVRSPRLITIPARDGLPLPGLLMLPDEYEYDRVHLSAANFPRDRSSLENGKLPVLIHVYGGPQAPLVLDRWQERSYLWHQWLCSQGYAVLLCENRSSHGRGVADTWPVYGKLGAVELRDLEDIVDWLAEQSWADSDRVGLWGWSYGGYLTAYAMTHSKRFKAGIAGAPVTDWRNYDAIYTERYMGLPEANPQGYVSSSVVEAAEQLHGRLLLIHGERDDNVHLSNTLQLVNKLQDARKPFDLMIYPKERHAIVDPKKRYQMYQMMSEFLDCHLKGAQ